MLSAILVDASEYQLRLAFSTKPAYHQYPYVNPIALVPVMQVHLDLLVWPRMHDVGGDRSERREGVLTDITSAGSERRLPGGKEWSGRLGLTPGKPKSCGIALTTGLAKCVLWKHKPVITDLEVVVRVAL